MFNTLIKESFSIQLERTKYTMYNKVYRLKLWFPLAVFNAAPNKLNGWKKQVILQALL